MIKRRFILTLTLCLLIPASAFAQRNAANKSWQSFWTQFSAAINKKDGAALKKLTASADNFQTSGADTPDEWIATIQKRNLWGEYRRSVASGTKTNKCANPCRVTKNNHLLFEFIGGRWWWTGLMGD